MALKENESMYTDGQSAQTGSVMLLFLPTFWFSSVEENQGKVHPIQATNKACQPVCAEGPCSVILAF